MKNVETILVPVDFSDCSPGVVQRAAQLAAQLDAKIIVMHALEKPGEISGDTLIQPSGETERVSVMDHLKQGAASHLPQYLNVIEEEGARAGEPLMVEGEAANSIISTAENFNADLIVMGTHGRVGLRRMLVGSVAESVLRRAVVPVLTVRSQHRSHCEASSCQSCTSGIGAEILDVRAELDG